MNSRNDKLGNKAIDFDMISNDMPEIANLIANQEIWNQYEQPPDFSDIPMEYQKYIPNNLINQKEDNRIYNILLTKK